MQNINYNIYESASFNYQEIQLVIIANQVVNLTIPPKSSQTRKPTFSINKKSTFNF